MAKWILVTAAYKCLTEAASYPQVICGCSMGSVATITIPGSRHFTIWTEDKSLNSLPTSVDASGKLGSGWLRLMEFKFEVVYRTIVKRKAPTICCTIQTQTPNGWQQQPWLENTDTHDTLDRGITKRSSRIFWPRLIRERTSRQPHRQSRQISATDNHEWTVEVASKSLRMYPGSTDCHPPKTMFTSDTKGTFSEFFQ